ncbi:MarR family winged helix-turn-helix transcriptional regulator [Chitinimonas naiadis]
MLRHVEDLPGLNIKRIPSFLIKRAAQALTRDAEIALRPLGIGMASLPVLAAIRKGEAATQAELARLLHVEQPSMAQTLGRLQRDGLIQRRPDPNHGRAQLVELTDRAKQRLPQAKAALGEGNARAMAGFSPEEVEVFVDFLLRVNANLGNDL